MILVGSIAMTVFLRTEMPKRTLEDGQIYLGALFFGILTVMFNGFSELALSIIKLPVFYKQRDLLFFPAWAYSLPTWIDQQKKTERSKLEEADGFTIVLTKIQYVFQQLHSETVLNQIFPSLLTCQQ